MALLEIPLETDVSFYRYKIDLDDVTYTLEFRYNTRMKRWTMNILDEDETMVLSGIACNVGSLLNYKYADDNLPEGFMFFVDFTNGTLDPSRTSFGVDVQLFYDEA